MTTCSRVFYYNSDPENEAYAMCEVVFIPAFIDASNGQTESSLLFSSIKIDYLSNQTAQKLVYSHETKKYKTSVLMYIRRGFSPLDRHDLFEFSKNIKCAYFLQQIFHKIC